MKNKKILIPKCPYCKSKEFNYQVEYIEEEYCEVTATCKCGKRLFYEITNAITFECTGVNKK